MSCFHPLTAYTYPDECHPSGKQKIFFTEDKTRPPGKKLQLPCGQCVGCRLERSRQWAVRCVHESQLHSENCFITLTYDQEHFPSDGGLQKRDFQLFIKRLRKYINPRRLRYFHCGEYGEENLRPHYHACIFGYDFPDRAYFTSNNGFNIYISNILADLWPMGFSTIGDVTFESAAYVARYIMKKVNASQKSPDKYKHHYERVDPETGEIFEVLPEYTTMSRRPGIAHGWFEKFESDVYPSDFIVINGKKVKPPKYYDRLYTDIDDIKEHRLKNMFTHKEDYTRDRLRQKEIVCKAKVNQLKRNVE